MAREIPERWLCRSKEPWRSNKSFTNKPIVDLESTITYPERCKAPCFWPVLIGPNGEAEHDNTLEEASARDVPKADENDMKEFDFD